ncbi:MAG: sulfotransferase [Sphingobium sp.]
MADEGKSYFDDAIRCEQSGDIPGAFEAFRLSAKADPTNAAPYIGLARILSRNHQRAEAIACLRQAITCEPKNAMPRIMMGEILVADGQGERARAAFEAVLAFDPTSPGALLGIAALCEDEGDRKQAAGTYNRLLNADPGSARGLSGLLAVADGADLTAAIARAENRVSASDDHEAALIDYALGKALARSGKADASLAAVKAANAARRRDTGPFDAQAFDHRIDQLIETFSAEFFARRAGWGQASERPIFIVGLPRSGTTLTEQILAAHPDVYGAGELDFLTDLATGLPNRLGRADPPWPQAACNLPNGGAEAIGREYLDRVDRLSPTTALRIIDKQPLNFWHLGLVAMALPGARIIDCRRDIRDNALSIFSEDFAYEQRWSTDLADIAHYWRGYRRIVGHWQQVTQLAFLNVDYEKTVADLPGQARRLLEFLDLPWDPSVLDFHKVSRSIQTPSRWQVRQPLYTGSVGRWRRHAADLAPLLEAAGV